MHAIFYVHIKLQCVQKKLFYQFHINILAAILKQLFIMKIVGKIFILSGNMSTNDNWLKYNTSADRQKRTSESDSVGQNTYDLKKKNTFFYYSS